MAAGSRERLKETPPGWYARAEAWFKLLASIVLAYLILERVLNFLVELSDVTVIFVGGVLLAYLVLPLVNKLNERLPLWAALSIVYGGGALLIMLGIYLLVPIMIAQAQDLVASLPAMRKVLDTYLSTTHNPIVTHFPPALRGYAAKIPEQLGIQLQHFSASFTARVVPALLSVATVGALSVAIPVVSIYMLAESTMIKRFFARMVPPKRRDLAIDILADIDGVIGGFVRGQLIVATVIGVLATTALLILHVPYAVLIGVWAGVADVVPYVGPFAGAIPAALVALFTNGWPNALGVIVAFTVINQFEGHLLGPRIVGSTVKVTPLAVIFALLIGAHVFGLLGLIIAVPVAGIVRVILVRLFPDEEITNAEIRPGLTQMPQVEVDPEATEA
ncbi:MAG TPA: AI-2E family transporter [Candidatus Limnocylindrales bacterium]|nr:AI-2E family transporter [Candidatus Limnocylindrales bacterium]